MSIIILVIKIIGISTTGYFSYNALTKPLKTNDGKLTSYGKRSVIGIILGSLLSISTISIEYFVHNDKSQVEDLKKSYLEKIEFNPKAVTLYAKWKVKLWILGDYEWYLKKSAKILRNVRRMRHPEYKGQTVIIASSDSIKKENFPSQIIFDTDGFAYMVEIPLELFLKCKMAQPASYSFGHPLYTITSSFIHLTLDSGQLASKGIQLTKTEFDLTYRCFHDTTEKIIYNPDKEFIEICAKYNLEIIENTNRIQTLNDLSNASIITETWSGPSEYNEINANGVNFEFVSRGDLVELDTPSFKFYYKKTKKRDALLQMLDLNRSLETKFNKSMLIRTDSSSIDTVNVSYAYSKLTPVTIKGVSFWNRKPQ